MENSDSRKVFGLVGRNIDYSFSRKYFMERFQKDGLIYYSYFNFDIADISDFQSLIQDNPQLAGLNVTIPYKESIIPYLHTLSKKASRIGAVNVIRFTKNGQLKGYNSDYSGFKKSIQPLLKPYHHKALILGTGGASKAVAFALEELGILYTFVSREPNGNTVDYNRINVTTFDNYQIIINTTPVGNSPDTNSFPPLPYEYFTPRHIAFDLIYNPDQTQFLARAKKVWGGN